MEGEMSNLFKRAALLMLIILSAISSSFAAERSADLEEGFEGTGFPPYAWRIFEANENPHEDNIMSITDEAAHSGEKSFKFVSSGGYGDPNGGAPFDQYLISPELSLDGIKQLSMWVKRYAYSDEYNETFKIGFSTAGYDPLTNADDFTWTEDYSAGFAWSIVTADVPANTKYIAIHYTSPGVMAMYLDDIRVDIPINNGSLSGTVTSSEDGNPIEGALVTINSMSCITDAEGNYSITDIVAGTYALTCEKEYFFSETIDYTTIVPAENVSQNFSLVPIHGDTCEDPIPLDLPLVSLSGSSVGYFNDYILEDMNYMSGKDIIYSFNVPADGKVSGNIEGEWLGMFIWDGVPTDPEANLVTKAEGMAGGAIVEQDIAAGDYFLIVSNYPLPHDFTYTISLAVTTSEFGSISGTVTSALDNSAIAGASVNLGRFNTNTDAAGQYLFENMATGTYSVSCGAEGFEASSTYDVSLAAGEIVTVDFSLENEVESYDAPLAVIAEVDDQNINLSWSMPNSGDALTESFEYTFPPAGWNHVISNSNWSWKQVETISYPDFDVTPHQGRYQARIDWDFDTQDEWLITPEFKANADSRLNFWTFAKYGSMSNDHYFVKISADGGSTWTPLWDASAEPEGTNYYDEAVNVDLSAYANQDDSLP